MAIKYDFTPEPLTTERTFATQLESEHFQENLPLIVQHADFIMEYREFAELRLSCIGYSFCWYKGEHICLGELLNYYKHGMAIVRGGCPHCGGDVYNRWSCGSILSGVRSNAGTCIKCGKCHKGDQGEFGSPKYSLPYELPEKHVSEEYQKVPWNIFYLVQLLKMKEREQAEKKELAASKNRKKENAMTLKDKMQELANELYSKCEAEGLNFLWEMHKAIRRFRREHPDLDKQWSLEAEGRDLF